jgi:hypothetical protein
VEASKVFFFEKKKQKTFVCLAAVAPGENELFWFVFAKKNTY